MKPEELLQLLSEALSFASIGLVRYRMNGEIIFIDQNAIKLFEVEKIYSSPAEVIGKNIPIYKDIFFLRALLENDLKKKALFGLSNILWKLYRVAKNGS
jgi:hypothetical protein